MRPRSPLVDLVRLVVVVATVVVVGILLGAGPLIFVIACVIVMVMVHELGHFATAKWSGMKVTEYFVGFGPRLWAVRRGETEYGVKAIPAGGYVKIPGMSSLEEIEPVDEPRTYRQQPYHQRIIVASAGSFMHFVMAFALALGAIAYFGNPSNTDVAVAGFVHWSGHARNAAQLGGLERGDVITAVNGHPLTTENQFRDALSSAVDKPVHLTVERHGRTVQLVVVPALGHTLASGDEVLGRGKDQHGLVGIEEGQAFVPTSALGTVGAAGAMVWDITARSLEGVAHVFSPSGIANLLHQDFDAKAANQAAANPQAPSSQRVESVVGIGRTAIQGLHSGMFYLLTVLIALNIGVAIINMLPVLPFDGGHVAIAVYERIRTRRGRPFYRADVAKMMPFVYVALALLSIVVVSAIFLDIAHPAANPFP